MHSITVTRPFAIAAAQVWAVLRDFDSLARWHPNVAVSRLDREQRVGCVRSLTLRQGGLIRERLESLDDQARRTSYTLLEGPLPVSDYLGTLTVRGQAGGCTVEWTTTTAITVADPAPILAALRAVYADGLAGLEALLSARPA